MPYTMVEIRYLGIAHTAMNQTKGNFMLRKKTVGENKKAEPSPAFSPNLTMNLTYLCYGSVNILYRSVSKKGLG